jgi:glycosyltransferase involved in cell wall biosynthesis
MRLAMFVHVLDDRAVSRLVLALSRVLVDEGFQVVLICATREQKADVEVPIGVRVEDLGIGSRSTAFATARLVGRLRRVRPDVLFAHLNGPGRAAIVARALARVHTRVVVVEHTHYGTFYLSHRRVRDRLTAWLYPLADRVAGVSPGVVEDLESRFPKIVGRTAVLPSIGPDVPHEPAVLAPPSHAWFAEPRSTVVCSVGNLVVRKGQATLVEALPLVRERVKDARLVLVGRFDDAGFVDHLRDLAHRLGVGGDVLLAGYQPDALPYIAHADVFAFASTTEGMGMVLMEAMALGTPVVTTDSPGGAGYVVDGGRCGLLVPVGDAAAMADAIVQLVEDRELRERLVTAGRARAAQFSAREIAHRYIALSRECVAG